MLKGKVAVITGGTRGIGFATAKLFLENGAKVAIAGSKQSSVDNALNQLKALNENYEVIGIVPNLPDIESVSEEFLKVKEQFGRIDILINNAGISARDSIYNYSAEDFKKIMDLNVTGVFNCTKVVAPIMKAQGGGSIVNTSSVVSLYAQKSGCGYPTSKFAVNGLTKSLARELGPDNIRVNAVAPGVTRTDMVAALPKEMVDALAKNIPLARVGEPVEVANAFLFLASDMSSYVSGTILSVDGATVI